MSSLGTEKESANYNELNKITGESVVISRKRKGLNICNEAPVRKVGKFTAALKKGMNYGGFNGIRMLLVNVQSGAMNRELD